MTYPKQMEHPSYEKSRITAVQKTAVNGRPITDYYGTPDRYPPVTVKNEIEEGMHRNMGYREIGEAPPPMIDFSEYPMMLVHPEHVDRIPDETFATRNELTGEIKTHVIKGAPEKFPAITVRNADEERKWEEKGYHRPGKSDHDAVQKSVSAPHNPEHVHEEWPKVVGYRSDGSAIIEKAPGKVIDPNRYPMAIGDRIANSEEEERALRGGKLHEDIKPQSKDAALQDALARIAELEAKLSQPKTEPPKSRGGRPRGSKNRAKVEPQPQA